MMKNVFHIIPRACFVVDSLVVYQNDLIKKIRLVSYFVMSQPGYHTQNHTQNVVKKLVPGFLLKT